MEEVYNLYKRLLELQSEAEIKTSFISLKSSLIEKYLCFFSGNNLEKRYSIKVLFEFLKLIDKKFDIKNKDINKIIHETGLKLFLEGKLTNMEILYLIKECPELRNDIFQNIEKYNIQKEEFWRTEESDNYILLNKLLTEGSK